MAGTCAGLVNGLFGGGGGMVLIPLLIHRNGLEEKHAFATSVCIILPISLVSATIYWFRTDLQFAMAAPYLLGGLLGGILSSTTFRKIPVPLLRKILALFLLWGGLRYLL
ncbi:MAG: TSUP family transporter [Oscillospiraceae bacterium]|jgi:uncharacterized membrane protein YfcA